MRKSAQGGRRAGQPLRMDSDDPRISSSRRTLDARRGSGIPQPNFSSKAPRSSSENRSNRVSALQPMKRSKSQINMNLLTPGQYAITPQRGVPQTIWGSGQRLTSPFSDGGRSSRKSAYNGVRGSKPSRVFKDSRPLTDKNFQQQEIQKITSFLYSQPDALTFAPKGINLRQLTMKLFVELVNYLLDFLDEENIVNMTNYVTEIPLIMKKIGYMGNLNASWLKTVNTQHALPHVLGLLSWLVSLASASALTDSEAIIQDGLKQDSADESFPHGNALVYMQHLLNKYILWNSKDEEGEENEERRFIEELCNRNGVGDEELEEAVADLKNMEMELNDPMAIAELEATQEEEKKFNEFLKDFQACVDCKVRMDEYLNTVETELVNVKQKLKAGEKEILTIQNTNMELKDQISRQAMTVEERDEISKACSDLSSTIREHEEYISVVSNQVYSDDLEMVKKINNIKKKVQAYNKIIVTELCWLPELEMLKDDTNILQKGVQDVLAKLDVQAQQLKSEQQKKHVELATQIEQQKTDLLQAEERKSQVVHEKEQYSEKFKQSEESKDSFKSRCAQETTELKRKIDSLKTANEAFINCSSLDEAKVLLQNLIDKREYGKTHLKNVKEKAKFFFAKSAAMTQGLIDSIMNAQEKYAKKQEEAIKNSYNRLSKIHSEIDELAGVSD